MCTFYVKSFFVLSLENFEKRTFLLFRLIVCVVNVLLVLYASYLYNLFHILLLPLQTYESMECLYVCMYVCMYVYIYTALRTETIHKHKKSLVIGTTN
jgi:hypothetical protein